MFSRASENTELLRKEKTEGESGRRRFYETDTSGGHFLPGRQTRCVSIWNSWPWRAGIRKALAQSA